MALSCNTDDYLLFINEKLMEYLPSNRIRSGDSLVFRCPICGDSHKNSQKKRGYYTPSKGIYHCFNCDASMSGLKLLEYLSGSNFEDIKTEYLRMKVNVEGGKKFNVKPLNLDNTEKEKFSFSNIVQVVNPKWKKPLSEIAQEYLSKRKVLEAPFCKEKFYSYFAKNGLEYILIPWKINGVEGYYQLNDFQKKDKLGRKYIFPKMDKLIYGLDNIDLSFPYIICFEGVYDSLFVKNGVCVGGKTLTPLQKEIIQKRYPKHQIVLAFDNDEPGFQASLRMIQKNPNGCLKFFKWFDKGTSAKDINDYILEKNNPGIFADRKFVEKKIISSIQMKMFLMEKGIKGK